MIRCPRCNSDEDLSYYEKCTVSFHYTLNKYGDKELDDYERGVTLAIEYACNICNIDFIPE